MTPGRPSRDATPPTWGRRLAWLLGLWVAGVAAVGLVALLLRAVMRLAGLSS